MKAGKGFVLIEVMLGMLLIGIFVVTIFSINLTAAKIKTLSSKREEAFNIARGLCEVFKGEALEFTDEDCKTLYKPVEGLDEIESIRAIFNSETGVYNSLSLAIKENKKYVLMVNLSKGTATGVTKGNNPYINILRVKVYIMGEDVITMTETR